MPINETPYFLRLTARITTLVTNSEKKDYYEYCKKIGAQPCTRIREFIKAELQDSKSHK